MNKFNLQLIYFFPLVLACSDAKFSISPVQKHEALSTSQLFDRGLNGSGQVPVSGTSSGGSGGSQIPVSSQPSPHPLTESSLSIDFICSNDLSQTIGGNVASSSSLSIDVLDADSRIACSFTSREVRDSILTTKRLAAKPIVDSCPAVRSGALFRVMIYPNESRRKLIVGVAEGSDEPWMVSQRGIPVVYNEVSSEFFLLALESTKFHHVRASDGVRLRALADYNPEAYSDFGNANPATKCDLKASPLIIRIAGGNQTEPLELSSQHNGVWFDILGPFHEVFPHLKSKISWFKSLQYYFIALPNADGEIRGIDELFGNNTRGPDGLGAANGYAALAKYDGETANGADRIDRADGYITSEDPVFNKLRLWGDQNFNGVAERSEILSLEKIKIQGIDLNFDPNFSEQDRHGNEIKMKSVVQTKDGSLHLIFDLWFKL